MVDCFVPKKWDEKSVGGGSENKNNSNKIPSSKDRNSNNNKNNNNNDNNNNKDNNNENDPNNKDNNNENDPNNKDNNNKNDPNNKDNNNENDPNNKDNNKNDPNNKVNNNENDPNNKDNNNENDPNNKDNNKNDPNNKVNNNENDPNNKDNNNENDPNNKDNNNENDPNNKDNNKNDPNNKDNNKNDPNNKVNNNENDPNNKDNNNENDPNNKDNNNENDPNNKDNNNKNDPNNKDNNNKNDPNNKDNNNKNDPNNTDNNNENDPNNKDNNNYRSNNDYELWMRRTIENPLHFLLVTENALQKNPSGGHPLEALDRQWVDPRGLCRCLKLVLVSFLLTNFTRNYRSEEASHDGERFAGSARSAVAPRVLRSLGQRCWGGSAGARSSPRDCSAKVQRCGVKAENNEFVVNEDSHSDSIPFHSFLGPSRAGWPFLDEELRRGTKWKPSKTNGWNGRWANSTQKWKRFRHVSLKMVRCRFLYQSGPTDFVFDWTQPGTWPRDGFDASSLSLPRVINSKFPPAASPEI